MRPICTTDRTEAADRAESQVARLATVDADGRPHLVPIVFALAGDTLYSRRQCKGEAVAGHRAELRTRAEGRT